MELDHRSKLDPKSMRCIFIGYRTSEYDYRFWDLEIRKILRHEDVVFNKMYKNLLIERSTSEKDLEGASQSTPEQQDAADSEFVELDDVPVKKIWSSPEGNAELRVEHPIPQSELRRSIRMTRAPERFFFLALSVVN